MSEIVDEILAESAEQRRPLVIFDLDSTLFNVSLRTQAIVETFARDPEMQMRFPNEVRFLSNFQILARDWGLKQALERAGFKSSEEFGKTIRDFWRSRFFSSEYLHHDRPYEGSREGVDRLHRAGADILYLTGRDEKNMKSGTVESLKYWGFPLKFKDNRTANLIMKPIKGSIDDEVFKENEMQKLVEQYSDPHHDIWFFENEPVIIERVRKTTPSVRVIWVDTTHSGRAGAPTDLTVVDFLQ